MELLIHRWQLTLNVICATMGYIEIHAGVFAGTSSGVNIAAAIALAKELGPGKVVATVACDTGLKYLAGDLFKN